MTVLGIDPGTTESGYALIDERYTVLEAGKIDSDIVNHLIRMLKPSAVSVESLACYGLAVGREVFETAYWIGEYRQVCKLIDVPIFLYPKPEYGPAITGVRKTTDAVLRQALLLRFGSDAKGGPLFKLKGSTDQRSAFAVAAYHLDKHHSGLQPLR